MSTSWVGYKVVGDNVDKNVKPRFQRQEQKGQSLHYFHGFAVKDRVDLSSFSDVPPPLKDPDPAKFLPSSTDIAAIKKELEILISRFVAINSIKR